MHKSRRRSLREKLVEAAELPKDITLGLPKITILAAEETCIENYRGIIEYTDNLLRLVTSMGLITVHGTQLDITGITDDDITIKGTISAVLLDNEEASS